MNKHRLIVVRHGQTDWNVEHRIQGQQDVPLNAVGRQQAMDVSPFLVAQRPTYLVSSDSSRAAATAIPTALACGLPLHFDQDLREIYVGKWEGLLATEAEGEFPEEFAIWKGGQDINRGGGETRAETAERAARAFLSAAKAAGPDGVAMAFSHGVSIRVGLDLLQQKGHLDLGGPTKHFGNTEWLAVDLDLVGNASTLA